MSGMVLCCAVAAVGSSLLVPSPSGEARRQYRVDVTLIEVRDDGGRNVIRAPRITTTSGAVVRAASAPTGANVWTTVWRLALDAAEESEPGAGTNGRGADCAWEVCVKELRRGKAALTVSLKRHDLERAVRQGMVTKDTHFNVRQLVDFGTIHRVALTHDRHGRATSWVEVLVEEVTPARHPFERASQTVKPTGEMQLCPFWYEPF